MSGHRSFSELADKLGMSVNELLHEVERMHEERSRWLTAKEAAEYLRCPLSRVRKLTMTGDLPVHRDGRRVLYRREELDGYIRNGGATSP